MRLCKLKLNRALGFGTLFSKSILYLYIEKVSRQEQEMDFTVQVHIICPFLLLTSEDEQGYKGCQF
jgi:hypothetical protein